MTFKIQMTTKGAREITQALDRISKGGLNRAIVDTLNTVAFDAQKAVRNTITSVFDRPKPYTVSGVLVAKASVDNQVAAVGIDILPVQDISGKTIAFRPTVPGSTARGAYLGQLQTGTRRAKRFEVALRAIGLLPDGWTVVPGQKAKMDAFGNQSAGEIKQILSYFRASELVAGSTQNTSALKKRRLAKATNKRFGLQYFAVVPGQKNNLRPGIYRALSGGLGRRIEPVMVFVQQTNYRRYFDFDAIVTQVARDKMARLLQRNISRVFNQERSGL